MGWPPYRKAITLTHDQDPGQKRGIEERVREVDRSPQAGAAVPKPLVDHDQGQDQTEAQAEERQRPKDSALDRDKPTGKNQDQTNDDSRHDPVSVPGTWCLIVLFRFG